MNLGTELLLFAVSLGAGALGGMLGMASGIFIVPVLIMSGQVDIRRRHRRQHRLCHLGGKSLATSTFSCLREL
jgi:uncharacterized membrane protein YfcA